MEEQQTDSALLAANGLYYVMPQPLSSTVSRTFKSQYSQRQSYAAQETIVFDINSGTDYVDPASCALTFQTTFTFAATPNAADRCTFGTGSAANLFQEIRIISKNGEVVDRIQSAHVLAKVMKDYVYSTDGRASLSNAGVGITFDPAITYTFVIPMSLISGFFRPTVKGMKLPAGLASGLRIELVTAPAARALHNTAVSTGTAVTYTISNPELMFLQSSLNDPTQAVLMANSQKSGLEYTFPSYFASNFTQVQTQVNEQVKKAVSQATRVFTTAYNVTTNSVLNELNDGFLSIPSTELVDYQYRIGGTYFPQKQIRNAAEAHYVTQACFNKERDARVNANGMSIVQYNTGGSFVWGHPIETDDRLNLSGLPLNNSNVLELRMTVTNAAGDNFQYESFVEFVAVARTTGNRTELKI
jgi:hypothetical protein